MFTKILLTFDRILSFFEDWSLFLVTLLGLGIIFVNIILRAFFNSSINWSDEVVRTTIQYTAFIGCAAAIKAKAMIKVDALAQLFPRVAVYLVYASHVATIIFSLFLIYFGSALVVEMTESRQATIILGIPYKYLYIMLPLMGALMLVRTIQAIWQSISNKTTFC